jgi:hypothetical protein
LHVWYIGAGNGHGYKAQDLRYFYYKT